MEKITSSSITVFPDTNIFLQCKNLDELDWREITEANTIYLVIPRTVQLEIDELKQSSNKRRSKRARITNSLFKKIIESDSSKYILKETNPYIEFTIFDLISRKNMKKDILDLEKADDCIINEVMTYKKSYKKRNVVFITHDTNPMQTAKMCNLPFISVPENWLLEPEKDKEEKEIFRLKTGLKIYKERLPIIEINAEDLFGNNIEELDITVEKYNELTKSNINNIIKNLNMNSL